MGTVEPSHPSQRRFQKFFKKLLNPKKSADPRRSSDGALGFTTELLFLSSQGNADGVKGLLDEGVSVDAADYDGRTALHLASSEGKVEVVRLLLSRGASVNPKDRWGSTPLTDAKRVGHSDVATLLAANGALVSKEGGSHGFEKDAIGDVSQLLFRAGRGDLVGVADLLDRGGVDASAVDYDGRSALHLAASEGRYDAVELLVARGADVDVRDRWGNTPWLDAARCGHSSICHLLEEHGAALFSYHQQQEQEQEQEGAGINRSGSQGLMRSSSSSSSRQEEQQGAGDSLSVIMSASHGNVEGVRKALEMGADPDVCDYGGRTGLHVAAAAGHLEVVRLLLSWGVDPSPADRWGSTPLADAMQFKQSAVVELLRLAGAQQEAPGGASAGGSLMSPTPASVPKGARRTSMELSKAVYLLTCATQGSAEGVRCLLDEGISADTADYDRRTALHLAAGAGSLEVVRLLLSRGADVSRKDRWGNTALADAKTHGHFEVASLLQDHGATVPMAHVETTTSGRLAPTRSGSMSQSLLRKTRAQEGMEATTQMLFCASQGDLEGLRDALDGAAAAIEGGGDAHVSVNAADYDRRTALHLAASEGQLESVRLLLDRGADANLKDRWGNTPLADARRSGYEEVAALLQARGGTDAGDGEQKQQQHPASRGSGRQEEEKEDDAGLRDHLLLLFYAGEGDTEGVRRLLDSGVSANGAGHDRKTALHLAASEGKLEVVKLLLERGANVNTRDRWANSAVGEAKRRGFSDVVALLLSHGAVPDLMGAPSGPLSDPEQAQAFSEGQLLLCASRGDAEAVRSLLEEGACVNAPDYDKRTALHLAASEGRLNVVELLLAKGADVNPKDRWGSTPLVDARRGGHRAVCELIEAHGGHPTQEEEREQQVAATAKRLFVANISHELRTPVNSIIACSDLLQDSRTLLPDERELAQMIKGSGQQLLSLITDILDYAKLEAGKMELHPVELSIWACLDFCMEMIVLRSQSKGLDLSYNVAEGVPHWIWADEVRLTQILTNLLTNASKFTEEGGEVEVSVTARRVQQRPAIAAKGRQQALKEWQKLPQYELEFQVRDTGIGMTKEFATFIFDAFTQSETSGVKKYEGTGLGMSIAKELAQRMGGRIWVESELGRGSTFHFTILAHGAMPQTHGMRMPRHMAMLLPVTPLAGMRALLVGATPTFHRMVGSILAQWGMRVTCARDVSEFCSVWGHLPTSPLPGLAGSRQGFKSPVAATSAQQRQQQQGNKGGEESESGFSVVLVDCPITSIEKAVPEGQMDSFVMEHESALLMMQMGCTCAVSVPTFLFLAKHTRRQNQIDPSKLANVTVLSRPMRVKQVWDNLVRSLAPDYEEEEVDPSNSPGEASSASSSLQPSSGSAPEKLGSLQDQIRICIADDNLVNQRVLMKLVHSMGYRDCHTAISGVQVLEMMKTAAFDLILMDLQMPEMDGFTATSHIRETNQKGPGVVITALTADTGSGIENECKAAGMNAYLSKPVGKQELEKLLERVMRMKQDPDQDARMQWLNL
eukprot:jgi/Mesen1/5359/ME000267S04506